MSKVGILQVGRYFEARQIPCDAAFAAPWDFDAADRFRAVGSHDVLLARSAGHPRLSAVS